MIVHVRDAIQVPQHRILQPTGRRREWQRDQRIAQLRADAQVAFSTRS